MKKGWKLILSIYGCILIMTVILLSIFGNYQRKMAKQDLGVIDDDIDYKYHYVFISGQKNVSFWNGIYKAAKERGKELGIYVEQLGSLMTEGYSIEEQLEIAIASKVDGIMIEPNGEEEVIQLINKAGENNIPVVTLLEDAANTNRISFIGVSSYDQGRVIGNQIIELVKEDPSVRNVTVLTNEGKNESAQEMVYGAILEQVKSLNLQTNILAINGDSIFGAAEDIRNIIMEEEAPDLLICLNPSDTLAAYQGVVDYNKVGKVKIIGFYDTELIPSAIEKRIVQSAVQINGAQIGIYGVEAIHEYINNNRVSEFFPVDIQMVTETIQSDRLEEVSE